LNEDLYLRLSVMQVALPPLRDRKGDIALLVASLIEKYSGEKSNFELSKDALQFLEAYDWPGNLLQLERVIERALGLSSGSMLQTKNLSLDDLKKSVGDTNDIFEGLSFGDFKRHAIARAVSTTAGDKKAAARLLGIGLTTLQNALKPR
jgi:transcriptional regulator with PAS, ATPase and Fis domain